MSYRLYRTEEPLPRNPITGMVGCCAIADSGRRATKQRDKPAPAPHSITSSARAKSVSGTVRPSAFAVFRLIRWLRRKKCPKYADILGFASARRLAALQRGYMAAALKVARAAHQR
jgi:hypothetical protein